MDSSRLKQLLVDYTTDMISEPDLITLLDYVSTRQPDIQLNQLLDELLLEVEADQNLPIDSEQLYQRIITHSLFAGPPVSQKRWYRWAGVAAALLLTVAFFLWNRNETNEISDTVVSVTENTSITRTVTTALTDKPILRLADGRVINLDSTGGGLLALEDGMQITLKGNQLHYEGELMEEVPGKILENTIITPKGRQYQVVLPDGSKIWLNAATKLVYPVHFEKDYRVVEISGEAYFEVQKASNWPFIVKTRTQRVEVLGTHFNISAYDGDSNVKTTLVEGSVKISLVGNHAEFSLNETDGLSTILKPGQQAITYKDGKDINIDAIDPYEVVSWKDNLFVFNDEEISEVMKKVSRWYDVEVIYKDGMAGKRIGGTIPKFERIEELMDALTATGLLRYTMEGGIVVIME